MSCSLAFLPTLPGYRPATKRWSSAISLRALAPASPNLTAFHPQSAVMYTRRPLRLAPTRPDGTSSCASRQRSCGTSSPPASGSRGVKAHELRLATPVRADTTNCCSSCALQCECCVVLVRLTCVAKAALRPGAVRLRRVQRAQGLELQSTQRDVSQTPHTHTHRHRREHGRPFGLLAPSGPSSYGDRTACRRRVSVGI